MLFPILLVAAAEPCTAGDPTPAALLQRCRDAALAGDLDAQLAIAAVSLHPRSKSRDPVLARRLLTAAAERGRADAALTLGQIYWNGDGTPKDNAAAARWWRDADAGGQKQAALLLGNETFVRLIRTAPSPERVDRATLAEAIGWFEKARIEDPASSGRAQAEERLRMLREFKSKLEAMTRP
ncbi:hypothetical protein [uncultured Sphingomonas sp.]|uniref:hypothetical protein n=1 Tax=uncultured Sphingomonas sp. TaxID=158754 RepID=UPI0035CA1D32